MVPSYPSYDEFYPPVNLQKTMERSTIFFGENPLFLWVIFNSYVKLPEGMFFWGLHLSFHEKFKFI
jgi:hypothetical protein